MNNKPIIIGVIILILLALAAWFYMKRMPSTQTTGKSEPTKAFSAQAGTTMTSLKDLLKMGKNQTCTFSASGEQGTVAGSTYIAGNNVRSDYKNTDTAGTSTHGSMIMDGKYMYSWNTATAQGFKMEMTDDMNDIIEQAKKDSQEYQKQFDPNAQVDYRCSAWTPDQSKFTPPADVKFMDFSEQMKMMEKMKEQMKQPQETNGNAQQCSACDSLQGEAQTACKQAMGC